MSQLKAFETPRENECRAFTITREQQLELYDEEYKRLMDLPKESLVEMLIGNRYEVGTTRI